MKEGDLRKPLLFVSSFCMEPECEEGYTVIDLHTRTIKKPSGEVFFEPALVEELEKKYKIESLPYRVEE